MRRTSLVVFAVALVACKLGRNEEQTDRPLPTPEPSSLTPPSRPTQADPPALKNPRESERAPARPATPTEGAATSKPTPTPPAPGAASSADSGAPAPAPTPTLALPAVDGGLSVPTAACIQKCQGRLSACMSKPMPLDAGLPSLESMAECKKAFEDCRADCS